ncbi:MAG: hypothetical protein M9924_16590 [Rhizobiaceae bacterium]|nr:hypothetical protein [Rhizobiaceae bacterium]
MTFWMFADPDQPKPRLISRVAIAQEILRLTDDGVPVDEWLDALTRSFYVDLDTYNEVIGVYPRRARRRR